MAGRRLGLFKIRSECRAHFVPRRRGIGLALTSGEIQFDVVAPQPHIAADLSGADILIIGTYFNKHTYSIVARPGMRSPQELRGKRIGVLSVIGLNQIVVATALRHWGIDEKSVTLVRTGGSRDRLTALQNGLIDATVLTGAFVDRAKAAGLSVLARPRRPRRFFSDSELADDQRISKQRNAIR